MQLAEFFEKTKAYQDRHPDRVHALVRVTIYDYQDEEGGGWRVDCARSRAFSDTLEDAIQAAFDAFTHRPSRHARLNGPEYFNWKLVWPARHIKYDYRGIDWSPRRVARVLNRKRSR